TALMDILSNLLFFLLASYTTQALEVQAKQNLALPASSSQAKMQKSLLVSVTRGEILVADVPVAQVTRGIITGTQVEENDKIVSLFERLQHVRPSRGASPAEEEPGADTILLLADKSTDSAVVTKVLKTAGMAGFPNVRFGVLAR